MKYFVRAFVDISYENVSFLILEISIWLQFIYFLSKIVFCFVKCLFFAFTIVWDRRKNTKHYRLATASALNTIENKITNIKDFVKRNYNAKISDINSIQGGLFQSCSRIGSDKKVSLPKISHTYHTMLKLGIFVDLLKKIKKIHKPCDSFPNFC